MLEYLIIKIFVPIKESTFFERRNQFVKVGK